MPVDPFIGTKPLYVPDVLTAKISFGEISFVQPSSENLYSERQKNVHERRVHTQNHAHDCENNGFSTKRHVSHVLAYFLPLTVYAYPAHERAGVTILGHN